VLFHDSFVSGDRDRLRSAMERFESKQKGAGRRGSESHTLRWQFNELAAADEIAATDSPATTASQTAGRRTFLQLKIHQARNRRVN